jgi:D-2-hydroxyacid dehydrogenase (NADP+)
LTLQIRRRLPLGIKIILKRILGKVYDKHSALKWDGGRSLKVLIETRKGFEKEDWLESLDRNYEGWRMFIDVQFVQNSLERGVLAPLMEVFVGAWLTKELLAVSPMLRWVHLTLGGVEFIDDVRVPLSIKITTATGVSAEGVAEHVIGLMIALDRRFDLAIKQQQEWKWDQEGILGHIRCLKGRTVGILGMGHNGQAVSKLALSMGMRVIGLDKMIDLKSERIENVCFSDDLSALLKEADFIVLCVPLTKETRKLIGKDELEQLRHESYLINVSRGEVVDEDALAWALKHGIISGAALDVLSTEPPAKHHSLRKCPNLIITPHVAGNIFTFRKEIRTQFVSNLKAFVTDSTLEGIHQHV